MNYSKLLDKIHQAEFYDYPFKYLYIEDFIPKEDFLSIIKDPQVMLTKAENDIDLINILKEANWEPIHFPGCTTDINDYIAWRDNKSDFDNVNTCEGFGITFRLKKTISKILKEYISFFESEEFKNCLCSKFNFKKEEMVYDTGFQKYLDGYEISPHPDVRKKSLTFMLNVNSNPNSEKEFHHAHFCNFKPHMNYVQEYWKGNKHADRSWVPWDWCETKFLHNINNSITLFSPDDDTMHGVKAKYNHFKFQRTQFYGNFWYKTEILKFKPNWQDFIIKASKEERTSKKDTKRINRQEFFNK